jgi:hypothetical protein
LLTTCCLFANRALTEGVFLEKGASASHLCIVIETQTNTNNVNRQTTNKMKKLIVIAAFSIFGFSANAQNQANQSSSASQTVQLSLSNAIEITFTGNNSATGADVTIPFTTVNDYANGVESDAQELKVRSNKNFSVAVKANAGEFSYTGNTTPAPEMPVEGVLAVKVTANGTGGSIAGSFSEYATLTSSNQDLITAADRGGNQTFSVKYKATPGFAYPAGTYAVDVVYTATQE